MRIVVDNIDFIRFLPNNLFYYFMLYGRFSKIIYLEKIYEIRRLFIKNYQISIFLLLSKTCKSKL